MKKCKRCKRELPYSEFYVHKAMGDGYLSFCKECTRARVNKHYYDNLDSIREYDRTRDRSPHRIAARKEYAQTAAGKAAHRRACEKYYEKHPERLVAKNRMTSAIKSGAIHAPDRCSECGRHGRIEGHHEDYSKPIDVIWLCTKCHAKRRK